MINVFLAGEGATELGGWAAERVYRAANPSIGVLEALLRKVTAAGWQVVDATCWKNIRKYRARPPMNAEVRNVMGVALQAQEAGAGVVAFTRDRDRDERREADVIRGIEEASNNLSPCPSIIGGVAIEAIEAWTLALSGERHSHRYPRPKEYLAAGKITDQVTAIESADIHSPELDSPSLRAWLDQARDTLASPT